MSFRYLLDKINSAPFVQEPFKHLHIDGFFSDAHFGEIITSPEICLSGVKSDKDLFDVFFQMGYNIIDFPGCIIDKDIYLRWHRDPANSTIHNNTACEGFGVTVRLMEARSSIVAEIMSFIDSSDFQQTIGEKFSIDIAATFHDVGIQKYADGYEISPHPDIRRKALTFMVNINPGAHSEDDDHHTHYLRFRPQYRYVQSYWEGNHDKDRCWVPWSWCETLKSQRKNNSIVVFAPDDDTLHGVRARYDHLRTQRTQLYGNRWYKDMPVASAPQWEDFVISDKVRPAYQTTRDRIGALLPYRVAAQLGLREKAGANTITNRLQRK